MHLIKHIETSEIIELVSRFSTTENRITSSSGSDKSFALSNRHISGNVRRDNLRQACTVRNFSSFLLPITALASIPGSGNTWSRHIIELITGNYMDWFID